MQQQFSPGDQLLAMTRSGEAALFRIAFHKNENADDELLVVGLSGFYKDEVAPLKWLLDSGSGFQRLARL